MQFRLAAFLLGHLPWLSFCDVLVGDIGQPHDLAQGAAEVAVFVAVCNGAIGISLAEFSRGILVDLAQLAAEALADEPGATAGDVDVLADQVAVDAGGEVFQVEVDVFHRPIQLGRVVVAQPFRVEVVQIALGGDEGAAGFRHLEAVDGQESVAEHAGWRAKSGVCEFCGPEQGVEVEDVLADEVVQLCLGVGLPVFVEVQAGLVAQVLEAAHVADRRIQPDVVVLAGGFAIIAGNLEAEVRRVARNVPVGQTGLQPFAQFVGGFGLNMLRIGRPLLEEVGAARIGQLEEMVVGRLAHRLGAGNGGIGFDQVGRLIGGAADFAVVAVLVPGVALWAFTLDEAIRQEHLFNRVVILLDRANFDQAGFFQPGIDGVGVMPSLRCIGRIVVVEFDMKAVEITLVLMPGAVDQLLRRDAFLLRPQHDRRAVGVVGAAIETGVAAHFLEAHPDIGLDIFDQMAQMDAAIGVRQGGGDENLAGHGVSAG